jgi:hypothetical protein
LCGCVSGVEVGGEAVDWEIGVFLKFSEKFTLVTARVVLVGWINGSETFIF